MEGVVEVVEGLVEVGGAFDEDNMYLDGTTRPLGFFFWPRELKIVIRKWMVSGEEVGTDTRAPHTQPLYGHKLHLKMCTLKPLERRSR